MRVTIEERAKEIAAAANDCCNRSDGYEEAIYELALRHLREVTRVVDPPILLPEGYDLRPGAINRVG